MLKTFDVKTPFMQALRTLYYKDNSLIRQKCCERSIVFRLGLYLARNFSEHQYDVDCEYNKRGNTPKSLLGQRFNYPDIIVHKRGSTDNLLVAEFKTPNDTAKEHFQNDKDKLCGFTSEAPYLYQHGVHVYIATASCSLAWYAQGKVQDYCKYKVNRKTHSLVQIDSRDLRNENALDRWYRSKNIK